jgi:TonB family protein
VSLVTMSPILPRLFVLTFAWTLSLSGNAQITSPSPLDSMSACKVEGPVFVGKSGKAVWLDNGALLKRATHCSSPLLPAMARQARIEGQVLVDILVDRKGKVACARLIVGHPLLAGSAIDAAKDWTFRPMKQNGKVVSFYGHLHFQFSTEQKPKGENPCTVAHWQRL